MGAAPPSRPDGTRWPPSLPARGADEVARAVVSGLVVLNTLWKPAPMPPVARTAVVALFAAVLGAVTSAGPATATPSATPIPVGRGMFVFERPEPMDERGPAPAPAVLKVAADGSTTDVTPTGLIDPAYITASPAGDLFVADLAQSSIIEVSAAGVQSRLGSGLRQPSGLWYDGWTGALFVADYGNGRVVEIVGGATTVVATGLTLPSGVVGDAEGNLYVADWGDGLIKIDAQRHRSTIGPFQYVRNVTMDQHGNLVVADYNRVAAWTWAVETYSGGTPAPFAGGWDVTYSAKVDHAGNLFVANGNDPGPGSLWIVPAAGGSGRQLDIPGSANIQDIALVDDASEPRSLPALHVSVRRSVLTAGVPIDVPVSVTGAHAPVVLHVVRATLGLTATVSGSTVRLRAAASFSGSASVTVRASAMGAGSGSTTFPVVVDPPAVHGVTAIRRGARTAVSWPASPTTGAVYLVRHAGLGHRTRTDHLVVPGGRLRGAWTVTVLGRDGTHSAASRGLERGVTVRTVHFANRSSALTASARHAIVAAGRRLARLGYRSVRVIGFCAPGGTAAFDHRLSLARARAVGRLLRRAQLHVTVDGRGTAEPVAGGPAANRRAVVLTEA